MAKQFLHETSLGVIQNCFFVKVVIACWKLNFMEALTNIVTQNKTIRMTGVLVVNGSQGAIFTYIRILSVILL